MRLIFSQNFTEICSVIYGVVLVPHLSEWHAISVGEAPREKRKEGNLRHLLKVNRLFY